MFNSTMKDRVLKIQCTLIMHIHFSRLNKYQSHSHSDAVLVGIDGGLQSRLKLLSLRYPQNPATRQEIGTPRRRIEQQLNRASL